MATGTVKWFNEGSGYGFIGPDDGANDLFVRAASIVGEDPLISGERVEFESRIAGMGPEAIEVLRPELVHPHRLWPVRTGAHVA